MIKHINLIISNILIYQYCFLSVIFDPKPDPLQPPIYKNTELEQCIDQNKDKVLVYLNDKHLTDEDMHIVGYYLIQDKTVINILYLIKNNFIISHRELPISTFITIKLEIKEYNI